MAVLIGVDAGTTNTKAVAFDPATGQVVAVAARPTPYTERSTGERLIDPEALWQAALACLREVTSQIAGPPLALGVASMAEAGVPLDRRGQPLYGIIPWYDPRTEPQLQRVLAVVGPERLFQITGQATRNVYTLYKLLWLREHAPAVIDRLHRWLSVADYVAWRLTGVAATDDTLASRTMLFDQRTRRWSPELLALAGIGVDQLPLLAPSGTTIGRVTAAAAAASGLPAGVAVGVGGHDHLCGALAVGAVEPGQVVDSIGTAESLLVPVASYVDQPRLWRSRICCYAYVVPHLFVIQGGMAMSGGGLDWLAHRLYPGESDPVGAALVAAASVPAGAAGLLYFPYLGGNGAPVGDENVAAGFVGLRPTHESGHLIRAALEGIAFGIRQTLEVVDEVVGRPQPPVGVFGGGSRSPLWLQIRANVLGEPVLGIELPEAVAVGAALLAGVGAGVYRNAREAAGAVTRATRLYPPDPEESARYEEWYREGYLRLYPALAPVFAAIARFA